MALAKDSANEERDVIEDRGDGQAGEGRATDGNGARDWGVAAQKSR